MPCYYPITAYRSKTGRSPNGKWPLSFKRKEGYYDLKVTIPCGQCFGCRLEKSRQWAIRCVNESQMFANNCFMTLTYSDDTLPADSSINKRDLQLFWKRMRKNGIKFRYFASGEYGDRTGRPHYHACIFGWQPERMPFITGKNMVMHGVGKCPMCAAIKPREIPLFHSQELDVVWQKGIVIIGEVTFESAAYVARYVMKKMTGEKAEEHYGGRMPEFQAQSRRPGLGREWYDKYKTDVYPEDVQIIRGGVKCKPALYYDRLYDLENPNKMHTLHYRRQRKSMLNPDEKSWERMEVKQEIKKIKLGRCKRLI